MYSIIAVLLVLCFFKDFGTFMFFVGSFTFFNIFRGLRLRLRLRPSTYGTTYVKQGLLSMSWSSRHPNACVKDICGLVGRFYLVGRNLVPLVHAGEEQSQDAHT